MTYGQDNGQLMLKSLAQGPKYDTNAMMGFIDSWYDNYSKELQEIDRTELDDLKNEKLNNLSSKFG
eukprot:CAMPEP_0116926650 /NCGR_PEP_ID=MMETSP0467-20121206/24854_1 /TAXON_ID=283647 /ORGANISM="Mesodinium pulex, Strain SPMC105" /LENGTH=65 /DNA_ID=CAMNT_0004605953 /DNA_START=2074 /DNA_END=2271 /DNA_ORIENTATION=+